MKLHKLAEAASVAIYTTLDNVSTISFIELIHGIGYRVFWILQVNIIIQQYHWNLYIVTSELTHAVAYVIRLSGRSLSYELYRPISEIDSQQSVSEF